MRIWPGKPYPLGATFDGVGTNISLFSQIAEKVELCLFDHKGRETRVVMPEVTGYCWHGYFPDIRPGQHYGFRVYGPWDPTAGTWCNSYKLLIDPYAKAFCGDVKWHEAVFPYVFNGGPDQANILDSAPYVPKSVVIESHFDWEDDLDLHIPLHETNIYEVHVKGFTARNPKIPEHLRGTYAGIAHPASIEYLLRLGITAVELLPVHQFIHDAHLVDKGLRNYWGYNTIGFFAPHNGYAEGGHTGAPVIEFKKMVKALHKAGIEVILDVVYNHTAEGNHLGPVLSFKGIDNRAYYRVMNNNARFYMDYTGTGNTLNMQTPHVLQMIMDSLRYWILEMHVDGFRFDLAATLARELHDVDRLSAFFDIIQQDPIISQVKLIAEPWDLGEGGYLVGQFPTLWSEWNGKYRDCARDFWRGMDSSLGEFAYRFTGSSDLYERTGRRPYASINFITAHDGFTLHDLVAYNHKHNKANGEGNRDGESHNRSWNCGVEGPTNDPVVLQLRKQQQRNFLATLFLSQGVPMLLGGDEVGRTQQGNNNVYCQDNELSWFDWDHQDEELLEFTQKLILFRKEHPVFRRRGWFQGQPIHGSTLQDIAWFKPDGDLMTEKDWHNGVIKSFQVFLNGTTIQGRGAQGEQIFDQSFLVLFNSYYKTLEFTFPANKWSPFWEKVIDTAKEGFVEGSHIFDADTTIIVPQRCLLLFRAVPQVIT